MSNLKYLCYIHSVISQTIDYALRAMVVIATKKSECWRHGDIAKLTKAPPDYLSKVLQLLARAKLVRSQRGAHGGFSLLKDPSEISLLEVVNAVEPIKRIRKCPLGLKSHGTRLCPLHKKLDKSLEETEKAFASTTLGDLLIESQTSISRPCDFPLIF